ncbi:hypothetical protein SDC9_194744 [bioreactor metagenome]|uniref:Uncharacterized protein n=1 Tax=bioreactor metagenome TaxID=1076179 RepID=A0A645IFS0_9ZZZZ
MGYAEGFYRDIADQEGIPCFEDFFLLLANLAFDLVPSPGIGISLHEFFLLQKRPDAPCMIDVLMGHKQGCQLFSGSGGRFQSFVNLPAAYTGVHQDGCVLRFDQIAVPAASA